MILIQDYFCNSAIDTYLPFLADRKSHEGSSVASQVVLASRLAGRRPRVSLLLMDEPHVYHSGFSLNRP